MKAKRNTEYLAKFDESYEQQKEDLQHRCLLIGKRRLTQIIKIEVERDNFCTKEKTVKFFNFIIAIFSIL